MLRLSIIFLLIPLSGCISEIDENQIDPIEPTMPTIPEPEQPEPIQATATQGSIQFTIPSTQLPGTITIRGTTYPVTASRIELQFLPPGEFPWKFTGNQSTQNGSTTIQSNYSWSTDAKIFPGAWITTCTLSWILRDATNETLYAVTAGHCGEVGKEFTAIHENSGNIYSGTQSRHFVGTVKYSIDEENRDFGFIEIADESRHLVSPAMQYFTGPVGVGEPTEYPRGDEVCFYGNYGLSPSNDTNTRCGKHDGADGTPESGYFYGVSGFASGGDSGGPVIHYETGQALGMISNGQRGVHFVYSSLCDALEWLQGEHNETLQLMVAPYEKQESPPNIHPNVLPFWEDTAPSCSNSIAPRLIQK
jgi:hypothetical protein